MAESNDRNDFTIPDTKLVEERNDVYTASDTQNNDGGILARIRGLFGQRPTNTVRDLDRQYLVEQLPRENAYIGAVKIDGDRYLRLDLTGELYEPHEIRELIDDLAAFDGLGAAEIDPFETYPVSKERLE